MQSRLGLYFPCSSLSPQPFVEQTYIYTCHLSSQIPLSPMFCVCVCVCIPARLSSLSLPSLFSVYSFIHSFVCLYPYSPCLLHTVCTSAALVIFFENGKKMNHTSSLFTSCLLSPFKTPQFKIFQNLLCTFLNSHNKVAQRTWVYKERRREK